MVKMLVREINLKLPFSHTNSSSKYHAEIYTLKIRSDLAFLGNHEGSVTNPV